MRGLSSGCSALYKCLSEGNASSNIQPINQTKSLPLCQLSRMSLGLVSNFGLGDCMPPMRPGLTVHPITVARAHVNSFVTVSILLIQYYQAMRRALQMSCLSHPIFLTSSRFSGHVWLLLTCLLKGIWACKLFRGYKPLNSYKCDRERKEEQAAQINLCRIMLHICTLMSVDLPEVGQRHLVMCAQQPQVKEGVFRLWKMTFFVTQEKDLDNSTIYQPLHFVPPLWRLFVSLSSDPGMRHFSPLPCLCHPKCAYCGGVETRSRSRLS